MKKDYKEWLITARKIFHFIATVLMYSICLIMIIVFLVFVINFIDKQYNLQSGKNKKDLFSAYTIVSPSMVPTINVEDGIIIQRIEPEHIKQGDIISFLATESYYRGKVITHRVIGIEKSSDGKLLFRTKGDHNNVADSFLVNEENVYGKVIFRIPMLGYIRQFLSTYFGWILCIVISFLYLILSEVVRVRRMISSKEKQKA